MWQFLKQYFMPIYVSKLDQFLQHFDATHVPSAVQQKEMAKYSRLYQLRDQAHQIEMLQTFVEELLETGKPLEIVRGSQATSSLLEHNCVQRSKYFAYAHTWSQPEE